MPRMTVKYLLVDFENVPKLDLDSIPPGITVPFFFGASQRKVETTFLRSALRLGPRFIPIDIEGQGKNALDFHIAFYLGEYFAKEPGAECVILSKDKGFDPLVKHLRGRGFKAGRAATVADAFPSVGAQPAAAPVRNTQRRTPSQRATPAPRAAAPATSTSGTNQQRAHELLARMPKRNRPRTRKRLHAHLKSAFAGKLDDDQVNTLINELVGEKAIREDAKGTLVYLV